MGISLSQSCNILAHSPLLVNNCIGFLKYKGYSQKIRLDPEHPELNFVSDSQYSNGNLLCLPLNQGQ